MSVFTQLLVLVLFAAALWFLLAIFMVRWFRRALHAEMTEQFRLVSEQLRAVAESETSSNEQAPAGGQRVKDPQQTRQAIASVRERVRATAEEQSRQVEMLQLELQTDEVTGLATRRYFINELRRCLRPLDDAAPSSLSQYGHVLIFRQRDLTAINIKHSRQTTDAWLRNVGDSLREIIDTQYDTQRPMPQVARLNGSDFVVLLAAYDGPDATDLIETLRKKLDSLRISTAEKRLCRWSYALTDFGPGCDVGQILARLDHGLMRAENAGHAEVEYIASSEYRSSSPARAGGETAWKSLIQEALREHRLTLNIQAASYLNDDTPERKEAWLSMRSPEDGSTISGYLFMPPAVRLGLSGACDLRAVELGCDWVHQHSGTLVLRISLASVLLPDFLPDLERALREGKEHGAEMHRLVLEIDAHGFVAYPDELDVFCKIAENMGVGVGVRRLAEQPAALLRLHKASVLYIKLGGDLISGLMDSPGATQLIAAITESAIGQGIKVYAHDVPNAPIAALLQEYGVLLPVDETFPEDEVLHEGEFVDD